MQFASKVLLILLVAASFVCQGQIQTFFVRPIETDPAYSATEDSSAISINPSAPAGKLFLFMGGTGSSSSTNYNALRELSASLGFAFINLSYPNGVAAASQSGSSDNQAFAKYREEICFGTPGSDTVSVDSLNSIYTRTLKLLQYLNLTFPANGWDQYLTSTGGGDEPDWSKIVVGGHSQGSGHAAYLAKKFPVDRVLMFAGPNDYSDFFSDAAGWLADPGLTSPERHFSYLSLNDEVVDFAKQYTVIEKLGLLTADDTTYVDNAAAPYASSNCLYTTQPPGLFIFINHNTPVQNSDINDEVWTYMLTSDITTGIQSPPETKAFSLYPNPVRNYLIANFPEPNQNEVYKIYSVNGRLIDLGVLSAAKSFNLDVSQLEPAIYFLQIGQHFALFIKE